MEAIRYVKVANNLLTLPDHIPEWIKNDMMRGKSLRQEDEFWKDVQRLMETARIDPHSNVGYTLLTEVIILNRLAMSQNAKISRLSHRMSELENIVLALRNEKAG